jgi:hypothetical protein
MIGAKSLSRARHGLTRPTLPVSLSLVAVIENNVAIASPGSRRGGNIKLKGISKYDGLAKTPRNSDWGTIPSL